jgi:hypothetical protein
MDLLDLLKQLDGEQKIAIKQIVGEIADNIYKGNVEEFFKISGEEYRPIYENFKIQRISADKDFIIVKVEKDR